MTEFMGELAGVLIFLIVFLLMFYVITEMTAIYFTGKSIAENVKQRREKKKKNKKQQNYYGCDCSSCKKRKVCMYSKTLDTYKDNAILYVSANSETTNDLFDLHVICKQYEHEIR